MQLAFATSVGPDLFQMHSYIHVGYMLKTRHANQCNNCVCKYGMGLANTAVPDQTAHVELGKRKN